MKKGDWVVVIDLNGEDRETSGKDGACGCGRAVCPGNGCRDHGRGYGAELGLLGYLDDQALAHDTKALNWIIEEMGIGLIRLKKPQ